jgi:hypothetical protein
MSRLEVLDKDRHRDLRILVDPAAKGSASRALFPVTLREFAAAAGAFPVAFRPTGGGGFEPVAVLGFSAEENLFLANGAWRAPYAPLSLRAEPFAVLPLEGEPGQFALGLDVEHPRVSRTEGERLFFSQGLRTDYQEEARRLAFELFEGRMQARAFADALSHLELLEPLRIEVEFGDGEGVALTGLFGVKREALYALSSEAAERLFRGGGLELAFLHLASLVQIRRLADLKEGGRP